MKYLGKGWIRPASEGDQIDVASFEEYCEQKNWGHPADWPIGQFGEREIDYWWHAGPYTAIVDSDLELFEGSRLRGDPYEDYVAEADQGSILLHVFDSGACLRLVKNEVWETTADDELSNYTDDGHETTYDAGALDLLLQAEVKKRELQMARRAADARRTLGLEAEAPRRREAIPSSVREYVWQRDAGRCRKCGATQDLEFDHMIPFSWGGSSGEENLQLLCLPCNRSKGATLG